MDGTRSGSDPVIKCPVGRWLDRQKGSAMRFKVLVANKDKSEFFEFPTDPDTLGKKICETLGQASEDGYKVLSVGADYGNIADELCYDSDAVLYEINEDASALDGLNLNDERAAIITTLMAEKGCNVREAVERVDDYHIYWDCEDDE